MNYLLSKHTKKDIMIIESDTERDYYMNANEALKYNIIDSIIENKE